VLGEGNGEGPGDLGFMEGRDIELGSKVQKVAPSWPNPRDDPGKQGRMMPRTPVCAKVARECHGKSQKAGLLMCVCIPERSSVEKQVDKWGRKGRSDKKN